MPPSSAARSRIDEIPTPARYASGKPVPSSRTSTARQPSIDGDADGARARLRVARRVGDRLERDPVCGHLDRCGQRRQVGRAVDDDAKVAVQPGGLLAQRADESELVERRRAKVMDEPAYVGNRGLGLCTQLEQGLPGARGRVGELVAGAVELQRDPGERGPEPVVEVPGGVDGALPRGPSPAVRGIFAGLV